MKRVMILGTSGLAAVLAVALAVSAQDAELPAVGGVAIHDAPEKFLFFQPDGGLPRHELDEEGLKLANADRVLSAKIAHLARSYRDLADDEARAKASKDLTTLVTEQFAVRQSLRVKSLRELEARLKRLSDLHAQRESQKDRIVADRVQQVLRDAQGLGWGAADDSEAGLLPFVKPLPPSADLLIRPAVAGAPAPVAQSALGAPNPFDQATEGEAPAR